MFSILFENRMRRDEVRLQAEGLWEDSRKACQVRKGTCPRRRGLWLMWSSSFYGYIGETAFPLRFLPGTGNTLSGRQGDGSDDLVSSQCHGHDFPAVLTPCHSSPTSSTLPLTPGVAFLVSWHCHKGLWDTQRKRQTPSQRAPQLSPRGGVFIPQCPVLIYLYNRV